MLCSPLLLYCVKYIVENLLKNDKIFGCFVFLL